MAPRKRGSSSRGDIYVATESGSCEIKGESCVFIKGVTRVRDGHPLLKAVPDYFKPVENAVHYDIEQATAAPGEKRDAAPAAGTNPAAKAAKPKPAPAAKAEKPAKA